MKKDLKCKECGTIIIDRMLSYEDDFCSEECFEFYKNKTKNLDDFEELFNDCKLFGFPPTTKTRFKAYIINREKTLLADIEGKVEGMRKDAKESDIYLFEGRELNEENAKRLVEIACNLRQNKILEGVIKILKTYE